MANFKESASQTAGPYVHIGCVPTFAGLEGMYGGKDLGNTMITGNPTGKRITLCLRVIDAAGEPMTDAMIEAWQPGPEGSFGPTEGFNHWGRQPTHAETGEAIFKTLMPGAPTGQTPHILLWIAARGINMALITRVYFPENDNAADPVFAIAGERAATLVAEKTDNGYVHTIHLQGDHETVFFDV
ncbi:protocatechuate 3,4-dioxygenase subunit alpha [Rhodobacterales bacterium LSUCC0246]|nr:protocatechuate 3,4-dioxygenase subunit alpha [Rhodobacterales bacterium LSUCC0374]